MVFSGGEYLILYKPPLMHSAPLKQGEGGTLSDWCAERFPRFLCVRGRKAVEGGLLHRLDYETRGLVFAALSQRVMDAMLRQQVEGLFIKEYEAVAGGREAALAGFPPPPAFDMETAASGAFSFVSGFRYYGTGRKSVRPAPLNGAKVHVSKVQTYRTEITGMESISETQNLWRVRLRLYRGFRHQIRCHLAWVGLPILGDVLYGGQKSASPFELCAVRLSFIDPVSGIPRSVCYDGA